MMKKERKPRPVVVTAVRPEVGRGKGGRTERKHCEGGRWEGGCEGWWLKIKCSLLPLFELTCREAAQVRMPDRGGGLTLRVAPGKMKRARVGG
jgi:hypothetical protein